MGSPGMVAPATRPAGVLDAREVPIAPARSSLRCGSLASSGLPLVVREPASTQLFEPTPSMPDSGAAASACAPSLPSTLSERNSAA